MSDADTDTQTNLVDLIDQLIPPTEPPPISMIPQTWGWTVLACVAGLMIAFSLWRFRKSYLANRYRRTALAQLRDVGEDPAEIAQLLRRTALAAYPRADVASLSGQDWLAFLDVTSGGNAFQKGAGQIVATAPYKIGGTQDTDLRRIAETWVRRHKREADF